jgi:hypothetical protein
MSVQEGVNKSNPNAFIISHADINTWQYSVIRYVIKHYSEISGWNEHKESFWGVTTYNLVEIYKVVSEEHTKSNFRIENDRGTTFFRNIEVLSDFTTSCPTR